MKKGMNRIQRALLAVIGVLALILIVVMIRKSQEWQQEKVKQEELNVRHQEIQSELEDIELQIKELSGDGAALQEFLDQKINRVKKEQEEKKAAAEAAGSEAASQTPEGSVSENGEVPAESVTANSVSANGVSEEGEIPAESVTANSVSANDVSEEGEAPAESVTANSVSANGVSEEGEAPDESVTVNSVSANGVSEEGEAPDESVTVNSVSANGVSEEGEVPDESVTVNSVSGNGLWNGSVSGNAIVDGRAMPFRYEEQLLSLEERRSLQSSYAETAQLNEKDRLTIAENSVDFSGMTIACLGDSLTEGNIGDNGERYSYPSMLKDILKAKEVYNLGIGGSSLGRYWDKAFVDRYREIPKDVDVILVMGGANDGFCASAEELGSLAERKKRTFYGDVDELMRGLKKDYPQAKIIFATPLPNVLQDYLMTQRDFLLPQTVFVNAIRELAAEYGIDVIDLYNINLLDTHDSQIIANYMPDGVHGNEAGYRILAEHMAGALIESFERDQALAATVSGNTVSGNEADKEASVSANETLPAEGTQPIDPDTAGQGQTIEPGVTEPTGTTVQTIDPGTLGQGQLIDSDPAEEPASGEGNAEEGFGEALPEGTGSADEPEEPEIEYNGDAIIIR